VKARFALIAEVDHHRGVDDADTTLLQKVVPSYSRTHDGCEMADGRPTIEKMIPGMKKGSC
jgi:hypothetical protein